MTITLEKFRESLLASGIMSQQELEEFEQSLPADSPADDTEALARQLVQARKLTRYQAAHIYQQKPVPLVMGNYVILEKIGAGGMGQVYKARHRRMERLAAIKILPDNAVDSPDAVQRFHQEVKVAARLLHANIVMTHDAGEQDGIHYLVMEYVPGRDLAVVVKRDGPLPVEKAIDYTMQAAQGLAYAHEQGVTHRDIKPGNLLLSRDGKIKILDMGLARFEKRAATGATDDTITKDGITQSGQIMGSVDYMSPEQAMDTRSADARSDIYSLGCTLYVMLTGKIPYRGDTIMKKLVAHRETATPSVQQHRPEVPEPLAEFCRRMMAKNPAQRPQTMPEVMRQLESCTAPRPSAERPLAPPSLDAFPLAAAPPVSLPPAPPRTEVASRESDSSIPPAVARVESASSRPPAELPAVAPAASSLTRRRKNHSAGLLLALGIGAVALAGMLLAGIVVAALIWFGRGESDEPRTASGNEHMGTENSGNDTGDGDAPAASDAGEIVLFDGSDLSQWQSNPQGWFVDTDQTLGAQPNGGDLWTIQPYGDYVLELEFNVTPHANSGVFLHVTDRNLPAKDHLEIQILDPGSPLSIGTQACGALHGAVRPLADAGKPPGHWNTLKITAQGEFLTAELNGQQVFDVGLDSFAEFRGKRRGYIGLQNHTGRVWFRNIRLRPLPPN